MNTILSAALALAFPLAALAGEHPKEHPTGQEHPKEKKAEHPKEHHQKGEHPAGHEHPEGSKHWNKQMSKEYSKFVESHVENASVKGGFEVKDEKLGKTWLLKLKRIHKDKLVHLGGKRFFACADFKAVDSKDKVDLDFYATKGEKGWIIEQILVHKVNGEPRYTYNDKNEMVPVR